MDFNDFLGSQKGFICSYNGLVGAPMGVRKVQKRVSGASPVIIGQLDHNVVIGTKSGSVQDLQRGKKPTIGFMETPLDQR